MFVFFIFFSVFGIDKHMFGLYNTNSKTNVRIICSIVYMKEGILMSQKSGSGSRKRLLKKGKTKEK